MKLADLFEGNTELLYHILVFANYRNGYFKIEKEYKIPP